MAGRKKGQIIGRYVKTCYYSKQDLPLSAKEVEETCFAYPFAAELKRMNEYLKEYEKYSKWYSFLGSNRRPTGDSLVSVGLEIKTQANNRKSFCSRCESNDSIGYRNCDCRAFVSQENELKIVIQDKLSEDGYSCPSCNNKYYEYGSKKVSVSTRLQDIRLLSRPTALVIDRSRSKCPNCGTLAGKQQIYGFQAICDGALTCRLAENVLYAQLSGIKRERISEAYGISKSQVDRIKKRMIEQSKDLKMKQVILFLN